MNPANYCTFYFEDEDEDEEEEDEEDKEDEESPTTSADSCGGSLFQISWFKDQILSIAHLNDLSAHQTKLCTELRSYERLREV